MEHEHFFVLPDRTPLNHNHVMICLKRAIKDVGFDEKPIQESQFKNWKKFRFISDWSFGRNYKETGSLEV